MDEVTNGFNKNVMASLALVVAGIITSLLVLFTLSIDSARAVSAVLVLYVTKGAIHQLVSDIRKRNEYKKGEER